MATKDNINAMQTCIRSSQAQAQVNSNAQKSRGENYNQGDSKKTRLQRGLQGSCPSHKRVIIGYSAQQTNKQMETK